MRADDLTEREISMLNVVNNLPRLRAPLPDMYAREVMGLIKRGLVYLDANGYHVERELLAQLQVRGSILPPVSCEPNR